MKICFYYSIICPCDYLANLCEKKKRIKVVDVLRLISGGNCISEL